jgi:NADPH-dependent curcumin reductase CurA
MTGFPARYRKLVLTGFGDALRGHTAIVEAPWQDPGPGEVVVRNVLAGVNGIYDLNMARNAVDYITVVPPADLGIEVVGRIVALGPGVTDFAVGDAVATWKVGTGYRDFQVAETGRLYRIPAPAPEYLALIPSGASGLVGLEQVGEMTHGEVVAVSAAAGALGHIVVQAAKLAGNHVIALAGSADKCARLRALGCDRAIDYRAEDLDAVLAREYPRGIDIAYDSVGGTVFDTFLDHLAVHGRLVISGYTAEVGKPVDVAPRPRPWTKLYFKSASIRGFINPHFKEAEAGAISRLLDFYQAGRLQVWVDPTPFVGLEAVVDAVEYLLAGKNIGKVVVRLADDPGPGG